MAIGPRRAGGAGSNSGLSSIANSAGRPKSAARPGTLQTLGSQLVASLGELPDAGRNLFGERVIGGSQFAGCSDAFPEGGAGRAGFGRLALILLRGRAPRNEWPAMHPHPPGTTRPHFFEMRQRGGAPEAPDDAPIAGPCVLPCPDTSLCPSTTTVRRNPSEMFISTPQLMHYSPEQF